MKETKFKQTEVGLIPNDWGVKKIGELCSITTGSQNTQDHKEDGKYPFFVRSQEVERIDKYIFDTEGVVTAGDGVGTGKIFHYVNGKFGLHQRCYLMYEFDRNISAKYFYWIFSVNFYDRVHSMTAKSSVDSVRREMIADMPIALPPIKEQQRIANALSDVDTLIANLEKLIAKKKNIKQGAMQQLLTGKKRLPGFGSDERREMKKGNRHCEERSDAAIQSGYKMTELGMIPSNWENTSLNKVVEFLNGDRGFNYPKDSDFCDLGIPFINAGHLKKSQIDFTSMDYITESHYKKMGGAKIKKDDILFCLRGSLGKYAYVNFNDAAPASSLCVLRSKRICPKFLFQILGSDYIKKQIVDANSGSSQPNLSAKDVGLFNIIMPSTIDEQSAIANVLSDMDTEIATLETKLAKYSKLKTGMMQQFLTGKIRLV